MTSVSWPTAEITGTGERGDRARDDLLVERPEILDRSAAAADDDDVDAVDARRSLCSAARDLERRALALHARRTDDEVRVGVAPAEHLDDVADRRAVERGDDADLARQRRQRPLARGVEQPFGLQPLLQLIEGELQRAEPLRLEVLADELIFALGLVDRDAAARDDVQAVVRLELQVAQRRAEHHALDLRAGVLQREVQVAGVPDAAVRELALDPDFEELGLRADRGRGR